MQEMGPGAGQGAPAAAGGTEYGEAAVGSAPKHWQLQNHVLTAENKSTTPGAPLGRKKNWIHSYFPASCSISDCVAPL